VDAVLVAYRRCDVGLSVSDPAIALALSWTDLTNANDRDRRFDSATFHARGARRDLDAAATIMSKRPCTGQPALACGTAPCAAQYPFRLLLVQGTLAIAAAIIARPRCHFWVWVSNRRTHPGVDAEFRSAFLSQAPWLRCFRVWRFSVRVVVQSRGDGLRDALDPRGRQ